MEEEEDKRVIGPIAAAGSGLVLLYLLLKRVAPPLEITDFKVEKVEAGAAATKKFAPGDTVTTTIDYNNETRIIQVRDVVIIFGTYDPDTGEFTPEVPGIVIGDDENFSTGTGNTYTSGTWNIPAISGTFDVLVALGTLDPDTGDFTPQDNETYIKQDYIEIEAVVEITNFKLSKA